MRTYRMPSFQNLKQALTYLENMAKAASDAVPDDQVAAIAKHIQSCVADTSRPHITESFSGEAEQEINRILANHRPRLANRPTNQTGSS